VIVSMRARAAVCLRRGTTVRKTSLVFKRVLHLE